MRADLFLPGCTLALDLELKQDMGNLYNTAVYKFEESIQRYKKGLFSTVARDNGIAHGHTTALVRGDEDAMLLLTQRPL